MPLKEWLYNTKQRFEVWVPAVAGMTVGKVETFIVKESFYPQAPLRVNVGGDKYAKLKLCHEKQNIPGLEMQPNFRRIPHPLKVLPYQVEEQGAKLGASVINTAMMVFVLLVFLGDNGIAAVTNIMASLTVLSFLVDRCFAMIGFYAKVALSTIDPYRPVRRNELQKMGMAVWEAGCTLLFGHPLPRFKLAYNS